MKYKREITYYLPAGRRPLTADSISARSAASSTEVVLCCRWLLPPQQCPPGTGDRFKGFGGGYESKGDLGAAGKNWAWEEVMKRRRRSGL